MNNLPWTVPTAVQQRMERYFKRIKRATNEEEAHDAFVDAVEDAWYNK